MSSAIFRLRFLPLCEPCDWFLGRTIVVHGRQGIGRASLVLALVLMSLGLDVDVALAAIKTARGLDVPETEEQRRWRSRRTRPVSTERLLNAALVKAGVQTKLLKLGGAGHGDREFRSARSLRTMIAFFSSDSCGRATEGAASYGYRGDQGTSPVGGRGDVQHHSAGSARRDWSRRRQRWFGGRVPPARSRQTVEEDSLRPIEFTLPVPGFNAAIITAIRQWRFEPSFVKGEPAS